MNLIVQGANVETTALKELAKLSGASGIEQIEPNVFHLRNATAVDGIAQLCASQGLDWAFVPDDSI